MTTMQSNSDSEMARRLADAMRLCEEAETVARLRRLVLIDLVREAEAEHGAQPGRMTDPGRG